jgi:hypothetical protein
MEFARRKIDVSRLPAAVRSKWPDDVLDEGFTPLPKRLLRTLSKIFPPAESIEELQVILAFVDYLRPELSRGPSLDFLAFTAGLEMERFLKVLHVLEERGWVKVTGSSQAIDLSQESLDGFMCKIAEKSEEP